MNKFIPEALSKEIEKACNGIYPLQNVYIRKGELSVTDAWWGGGGSRSRPAARARALGDSSHARRDSLAPFVRSPLPCRFAVKTLKAPRFDLIKLMEIHNESGNVESSEVKAADVLVENLATEGGRL